METETIRSASVNYATVYPNSFYITPLIIRYISFCHQGQIQNFQILEVKHGLYFAMSHRQMGKCSTHFGLDTRCMWVASFTTWLIYPTPNLSHIARLNAFVNTVFSSCRNQGKIHHFRRPQQRPNSSYAVSAPLSMLEQVVEYSYHCA
jgi:hypothetical protein